MVAEETKEESDDESPTNTQTMMDVPKPLGDSKHALRDAYLRRPPNQIVTLIKSQFPGREPYVFFPYPPVLKTQRTLPADISRIVQFTQKDLGPNQQLSFKIHSSTHTYNSLVNGLKMAGFHYQPSGSGWNVLWTGLFKANRIKNINTFQRVNHFAGSWCIGRKDLMWRNV